MYPHLPRATICCPPEVTPPDEMSGLRSKPSKYESDQSTVLPDWSSLIANDR